MLIPTLPAGVALRAITPDDNAFMAILFAAGRQQELAAFPFNEQQKQQFLHSQFVAQYQHYFSAYNTERFRLITAAGEPIGRYLSARDSTGLHLVDIALLPAWQRQGIGQALLLALLAEARQQQLTVSLHVQPGGHVQRWYQRLGFEEQAGGNALYVPMTWRP